MSISWTFGGALLRSDDAKYRIMKGPAESILTVIGARANDAGVYTCIGKNLLSEDRVSATLVVEGILSRWVYNFSMTCLSERFADFYIR